MLKHSRIKRALYDQKERRVKTKWVIVSYIVSAIISAFIAILPQKFTDLEVFFITFTGGILGPLLIWIIVFLLNLISPIKRFSITVGELGDLGGNRTTTYFGIYSDSNELSLGSIKIKFILPNGEEYGWKNVSHKTFVSSSRIFLIDIPENLKLIEGIYTLKIKSTTWGHPALLIAENKFVYKNGEWNIYEKKKG